MLRHSSHPRDLLDLSCSIQSSEHNEDEDDDEYQNFDFDNDRDVEPVSYILSRVDRYVQQ